jgi:L-2-hydroxyglutarate oxidase LhgO
MVDAVVIGAGVVGLAVARSLAAAGLETLVVERHRRIGEEISSRNSGVIHSGIYYPAPSLKARLCVRGREQLYRYCEERGIEHRRFGKLIVAQRDQLPGLLALQANGLANGVHDMQWLEADQVRELEPAVTCAAALYSPSTGIVDVHELMTSLLGDFEARSGTLVLNTEAKKIRAIREGLELSVRSGADESIIVARNIVNSAGLEAVAMARRIDGFPTSGLPIPYLAKGNYFSCSARPFRHLVYPMPNEAGLGIHATLDLNGSVRFGPDVEWVQTIDYSVDPSRVRHFHESIREYWPDVVNVALLPSYAGIRPKIVGPGQRAADFEVAGPARHGVSGLVNLLGIESPGLTAALALGDHVLSVLGRPEAGTISMRTSG